MLLNIPPFNVKNLHVKEKTDFHHHTQAWMEAVWKNRYLEAHIHFVKERSFAEPESHPSPGDADGRWPPGVPRLNQALKQPLAPWDYLVPPGIRDHPGELMASAAVAPLDGDMEDWALQTML